MTGNEKSLIANVSDTALWVAYYRGLESKKTNPLFRDELAAKLAGLKGKEIADQMSDISRYTHWNVVMRTWIIDNYIQELVGQGVKTVVNLGAGLDTRPYRLQFPKSVTWIEVDYPHMIQYKENLIGDQKPNVNLERFSLDLSVREKRNEFFARVASRSGRTLILTEGVIVYLSEQQVSELAQDLTKYNNFEFWITEYMALHLYKYFNNKKRQEKMKNSPFQFFPTNWFGFFEDHGWIPKKAMYLSEESKKINRPMPLPWWAMMLRPFLSKQKSKQFEQQFGYVIFKQKGA